MTEFERQFIVFEARTQRAAHLIELFKLERLFPIALRYRRTVQLFDDFTKGPTLPVLSPQSDDDPKNALRILGILNLDVDLRDAVWARVWVRVARMPLPVVFRLRWGNLTQIARQELGAELDRSEALRRGGDGGRRSGDSQAAELAPHDVTNSPSATAAVHVRLASEFPYDKNAVDLPGAIGVPEPAVFLLRALAEMGPEATKFFTALAAGIPRNSAMKSAGISRSTAQRYLRDAETILKNLKLG
jgi:hypothetical protein